MKVLCQLRTLTFRKSDHLCAETNLLHIWDHTRASKSSVAHDNPHSCYHKPLTNKFCTLGGAEDLVTQAEELLYWLKPSGGAEEPVLNI